VFNRETSRGLCEKGENFHFPYKACSVLTNGKAILLTVKTFEPGVNFQHKKQQKAFFTTNI
jgi:hypothetical protein